MNRILNRGKICCPSNSYAIFNTRKQENFIIDYSRSKSYYTALGLDSNASQKDIKSAYYKLTLLYHPDKTDGCPEATEKFREVTEAYKVLGNPDKKKAYDENIRVRGPYHYDFRSNNFTQRPYRAPQTGRTRYYNYDEHYKQHYEEYMKQREMENEYFRRRWEADRRDRYGDDYRWQDYYRTRQHPPVKLSTILWSRSFIYIMTFWTILLLTGTFIEDKDYTGEPKIIYYNVNKDEKKNSNSEDE